MFCFQDLFDYFHCYVVADIVINPESHFKCFNFMVIDNKQ